VFKELFREARDGKKYVFDFLGKDLDEFTQEFLTDNLQLRSILEDYPAYSEYDRDGSPVVFLRHGFLGGASSMQSFANVLPGYGINNHQYNFMASLWYLTNNLIQEIEECVDRTGKPVSYIAHSKGGLMGIIASQRRPELFDKVVTMAVPFHGSRWGLFFYGIKPLREMHSGQSKLAEVYSRPLPDSVQYLNLYSLEDLIINPAENSILPERPNVRNVQIPGISHNGFMYNGRVLSLVKEFFSDPTKSGPEYARVVERRSSHRGRKY